MFIAAKHRRRKMTSACRDVIVLRRRNNSAWACSSCIVSRDGSVRIFVTQISYKYSAVYCNQSTIITAPWWSQQDPLVLTTQSGSRCKQHSTLNRRVTAAVFINIPIIKLRISSSFGLTLASLRSIFEYLHGPTPCLQIDASSPWGPNRWWISLYLVLLSIDRSAGGAFQICCSSLLLFWNGNRTSLTWSWIWCRCYITV